MQRHLPATRKLSVFFARYILQATLIVSCCCQWNAASAAGESSVMGNRAESSPFRPEPIRSVEPEIAHSLASFGTADRKDEYEPEEDSDIDSYVPADLSSWEQEAEDSDPSEQHGSDFDKRKWGDNKARVWGKRKWGDNRARVWGKRMSGPVAGHHRTSSSVNAADFLHKLQAENRKLVDEAMNANSGKRKWGENKARVWGK